MGVLNALQEIGGCFRVCVKYVGEGLKIYSDSMSSKTICSIFLRYFESCMSQQLVGAFLSQPIGKITHNFSKTQYFYLWSSSL